MQSPQSVEELLSRITRIRSLGKDFSTNLYALPDELQSWCDRREARYMECDDALIVLRTDRDVKRLYHAAPNYASLTKALTTFDGEVDGVQVAELLGRGDNTRPCADTYRACRFRDHTALLRMVKRMDPPKHPAGSASASHADAEDTFIISDFLGRVLDPLRDHVPTRPEICAAIAARRVLIKRGSREISGILFYEDEGAGSVLRYWYVDPAHSDEGIGGQLMREYIRICQGKKRISLWVVADNHGAIEKYRHYGFDFDGLSDRILIRSRRA
jgi:ribosomal protein S18 acetylase RimI-like enzyme